MNVFISTGHHPKAPGAALGDFVEHGEALVWTRGIFAAAASSGRVILVPVGRLDQKIDFVNLYAKPGDLAIEVHFNASPSGKGEGAETLFRPGDNRGADLAERFQSVLAKFFRDRGTKPGFYQADPEKGPLYFLEKSKATALILEPEFIYHAERIRSARARCCRDLAALILEISQ